MTSKVRLALIGSNGIPANYGGCETFYENLTKVLSDKYDITVYCSKTQAKLNIGNTYLGAKLKYINLKANGWQSIPYDIISILHAAKHSDVLYIFGASAVFFVKILRLFGFKKKVILNHGGLNEWEREKYTPIMKAYSKWNRKVTTKSVVHVVDNELYVKSLQNTFGIKDAHVIRYGGDQAKPVEPNERLLEKYPFLSIPYYVSVSRAQVDNNLHIVLDAFAQMPDKHLVLVSNFNISQYGKDLYNKFKDTPNITLISGVYNPIELNAIRSNAVAYVHSHSRCGTPPSLCEAMNLGLPIISFNAEVNHEVTKDFAWFFNDVDELRQIIMNVSYEVLVEMSKKSYELATTELTWFYIGEQYIKLIG